MGSGGGEVVGEVGQRHGGEGGGGREEGGEGTKRPTSQTVGGWH